LVDSTITDITFLISGYGSIHDCNYGIISVDI